MPAPFPVITGERRRCAVLGSPIAHSLSPVLHRAAYRHLGLSWEYTAHDVDEAGLAGFVDALDSSWRGLSLTMPLKKVGLELADTASDVARTVGAANTLLLEPDGRTVGENTDVPGMVAALQERGALAGVAAVCMWGAGATAASALAAVARLEGRAVHIHARDVARVAWAADLGSRLGVSVTVRPWRVWPECAVAELVVQTAPTGAVDGVVDTLTSAGTAGRLLLDVVYDPWPTALAARWQVGGGAIASGLDLLVHQAIGQVRLMTGHDVPAAVLRDVLAGAG
ncbi:MAG: shikimate dehydrogenase [Jiangellaceae bacterium]